MYRPTTYKFKSINATDTTVVSYTGDAWPDIAERFFQFLRGCGFELERQDISDYFDQSAFTDAADSVIEEHGETLTRLDDPVSNHAEAFGLK